MCVWRGAAWTNQAAAGPERINMGRLGLGEDGESGLEHRGRHIRVNVDLRGLHLHAHLIVLVAGLAASVLGVLQGVHQVRPDGSTPQHIQPDSLDFSLQRPLPPPNLCTVGPLLPSALSSPPAHHQPTLCLVQPRWSKTVMMGARAVLSMAIESEVAPVRRAGVPTGAKAAAEATKAENARTLADMAESLASVHVTWASIATESRHFSLRLAVSQCAHCFRRPLVPGLTLSRANLRIWRFC
jgi:hypothetical protein